jgi:serine phosphatase RsbU (regulator of sigma subunit)
VLTAAMTVGLVLVGLVGLARPVEVESRWVEPPAFIRRLEQERRVQHEMKLLTEMQAGLLPKEMPRLPGWQLAARSVFAGDAGNIYDAFADDSGQLWIAAGDVAGRGHACAIAQAMIKAGLASLAEPGESPASVLADLDRVLRTVDSDRSYTTLTLVRLDPGSGRALLANAGQPPALLLTERKVREIAVTGLPLGQGPPRTYSEQTIVLPAGAALVVCSDGLLAALDGGGQAYGLSRVAEILALMDRRPALEIVDTLLNDCRRHVGAQPLPDDLTVVVVRRSGAANKTSDKSV